MKIIYNCHVPFGLAHGGMQIQIEQTKAAMEEIGVQAEYLQWWKESQRGDILHHFGYLPLDLARMAQVKGWKVAITVLLTEQCNRSPRELLCRKWCIRSALATLPERWKTRLPWESYRRADQMLVSLEAERRILADVYGVTPSTIAVVPYGLSPVFLKAAPALRNQDHLICTGRIGPTKRCLELARLARAAEVPLLFVGKPFDLKSSYWLQFRELIDQKYVKHHEHVDSEQGLVQLLRSARGYVLLSRYENWCLAAHEAAACGLPLLLPDQPWSRERFGTQASYFPKDERRSAEVLRAFYEHSLQLPAPRVQLWSWQEVAEGLRSVYTKMMARPVQNRAVK